MSKTAHWRHPIDRYFFLVGSLDNFLAGLVPFRSYSSNVSAFFAQSSLAPISTNVLCLSPFVFSMFGPPLILPRDENPRCPPTDTNGYLCRRRNLLLYIPLYKQRVNRARTLAAPRTSLPPSRAGYRIRGVETDLSIVPRTLLLLRGLVSRR